MTTAKKKKKKKKTTQIKIRDRKYKNILKCENIFLRYHGLTEKNAPRMLKIDMINLILLKRLNFIEKIEIML
jgi:hypothetical protein